MRSNKFEVVINLRTAKTLGVTVPRSSLLLQEDEAIRWEPVRDYWRRRARAYSTASGAMESTTIARITNAKFSRTAGIPPNR